MSFILDALRKSENERQQGAIPSISDVPTIAPNTRIPKWATGIIAALSVGVLLLGWAWWHSTGVDEADTANLQPSGLLPRSRAVSPAAMSGAVRNLAREPVADTASGSGAAAANPATQPASEAETPTLINVPPTMMELLATGMVLPEMTLELHVYSATPADRFVHINSASYREGQILSEVPRVLTITEEGVVLEYRSQNFLLLGE